MKDLGNNNMQLSWSRYFLLLFPQHPADLGFGYRPCSTQRHKFHLKVRHRSTWCCLRSTLYLECCGQQHVMFAVSRLPCTTEGQDWQKRSPEADGLHPIVLHNGLDAVLGAVPQGHGTLQGKLSVLLSPQFCLFFGDQADTVMAGAPPVNHQHSRLVGQLE